MASPETIDTAALLAPIPGANPAGIPIEYEAVHGTIKAARQGSERSQFESEAKPADWRQVARLSGDVLRSQSKHLEIAVWLADALVKVHGFPGLRDGLKVLRGLHDGFWDHLYPEIDDGDLSGRANRLAWLNEAGDGRETLASAICSVPLTAPGTGFSYGWIQWKESRDVGNLALRDADKYASALAENRITPEQFDKAVAGGRRAFYEQLMADIVEALEECTQLEVVVSTRYGREAPSLLNVRGAIEECQHVVERIVQEKRRLEPDPSDPVLAGGDAAASLAARPDGAPAGPMTAEPVDRADALRRLVSVANFFRRTEPHSPVAYLVQRAVRWAEMPLDEWLKDVVNSDDVLAKIKETLGIRGE
jgi:type VI secretion system protein ImpA